jgi:hypothetical protein
MPPGAQMHALGVLRVFWNNIEVILMISAVLLSPKPDLDTAPASFLSRCSILNISSATKSQDIETEGTALWIYEHTSETSELPLYVCITPKVNAIRPHGFFAASGGGPSGKAH